MSHQVGRHFLGTLADQAFRRLFPDNDASVGLSGIPIEKMPTEIAGKLDT